MFVKTVNTIVSKTDNFHASTKPKKTVDEKEVVVFKSNQALLDGLNLLARRTLTAIQSHKSVQKEQRERI